jgi:hypothetical protein
MRRVATNANSIVRYLGRFAGVGSVMSGGEIVARAAYDFDGFTAPRGGVMSSGELKLAPSDLKAVFGGPGVQLLTDDGRLLDLRFSEKELHPGAEVAHVDVTGDLPSSPADWARPDRRGSRSDRDVTPTPHQKLTPADETSIPGPRRRVSP